MDDALTLAYRDCRQVWGAFLRASIRKDWLVSVGRDLAMTPSQHVEHRARLSDIEAHLDDLDGRISHHEAVIAEIRAREERAALGPLFSPPRTAPQKKMLTG